MRLLTRGAVPKSFANWKKRNSNIPWGDFSNPQLSHHSIYTQLRQSLIIQQENMCCYCEVALKTDTDAHIEHLQDRDSYSRETYHFNNLLASCQNNDTCGHKKGNGYFANMVSPLDSSCQSRFTYTRTGKIIPCNETDSDAQDTIELLGLNCKRLKDRRKSIIKTLENAQQDYIQQSLSNCVDWFSGFFTVIEYMVPST